MAQANLKTKKKNVGENGIFDGDMWKLWQVPIFGRDRSELLKVMTGWLAGERKKVRWIATVNPEFLMISRNDRHFFQLLKQTDLNVIDGIGLVWAREVGRRKSKAEIRKYQFWKNFLIGFEVGRDILKGKYRQQLASGSDLILDLCEIAAKSGYRVYFLGGWEDRAERTAKYFNSKFKVKSKKFDLAYSAGEPQLKNEAVLKDINKFKPDILFVAYGMRRQEEWIKDNLNQLKVGLVMGVGRSFDYYSGDLKRAPIGWRKSGFEWLYSLLQEPKRWKRQLELPKFVWQVLRSE